MGVTQYDIEGNTMTTYNIDITAEYKENKTTKTKAKDIIMHHINDDVPENPVRDATITKVTEVEEK